MIFLSFDLNDTRSIFLILLRNIQDFLSDLKKKMDLNQRRDKYLAKSWKNIYKLKRAENKIMT